MSLEYFFEGVRFLNRKSVWSAQSFESHNKLPHLYTPPNRSDSFAKDSVTTRPIIAPTQPVAERLMADDQPESAIKQPPAPKNRRKFLRSHLCARIMIILTNYDPAHKSYSLSGKRAHWNMSFTNQIRLYKWLCFDLAASLIPSLIPSLILALILILAGHTFRTTTQVTWIGLGGHTLY